MKKILVPTDFSKPAQHAVATASQIAKKANGKVVLLHVIEQPTSESFNIEGEMQTSGGWEERIFTMKMIEQAKDKLDKALQGVLKADVNGSAELRLGNPFHGMREVIISHKIDLVVMGTSGKSRWEEMLIGSNTEKVIRHAKCPVLTVHEKPGTSNFKKVVYATSLDDDEKGIFSVIRNTHNLYGATIHLVRINTPANFVPDHIVMEQMEKFAKKLNIQKYTLSTFSDISEEEGVIHFADTIKADLIAMSTHGRKGFAHLLGGSIAEDVANHARRPVLTYVSK